MKQGADCSLHLQHKKGVITTTLKCSSTRKTPCSSKNAQAEKKQKKKTSKNKFEALLSYHQRLVDEKGLPPSKLMVQLAAASSSVSTEVEHDFKCKICDFKSTSKHGVDVHTGIKHKQEEQSEPEVLRIAEVDNYLDISEVSEKRDESILPPLANSTLTNEKKEETSCFKCEYCKHKAKSEIKLSIHISKIHSIHEVRIGRIHKCAICEVDQRLKPMVRNIWYMEKDLDQHMKIIHEAPDNVITFS